MKRLVFCVTAFTSILAASSAFAQRPVSRTEELPPGQIGRTVTPARTSVMSSPAITVGELTPTPEMWFYQQEMARYDSPQELVKRNAAIDAAQRKQRILAMKWYGYSNSRPVVNPTPFGAAYAPTFSNSAIRPFSYASQRQVLVVQPSP